MNLNKVIIIGRIASEIDHRILEESNSNLARFLLAVNKKRRFSSSGAESSNFIPVVTWRQNADFVIKYLSKGSLIALEGYINVSRYTSKTSGNIVERFEVVGEVIESLEPRSVNEVRKMSQTKESEENKNNDTVSNTPKTLNTIVEQLNSMPKSLENNLPPASFVANNLSNKSNFNKYEGSAENFIESLRIKSDEIDKENSSDSLETINKTSLKNDIENTKSPKKPLLIKEEIISPGKQNKKIKSIIDSIWKEES